MLACAASAAAGRHVRGPVPAWSAGGDPGTRTGQGADSHPLQAAGETGRQCGAKCLYQHLTSAGGWQSPPQPAASATGRGGGACWSVGGEGRLAECLSDSWGERLREEEYEVPKETLSKTPPTSDSDYVDSGEKGEEEGERQLADVDISAVAPLAKRKVYSQTPPTLCLRLFILYCYSPVAIFSLAAGFLTDDLSIHNDQNGGGKYLGVCRLPGKDRKVRSSSTCGGRGVGRGMQGKGVCVSD